MGKNLAVFLATARFVARFSIKTLSIMAKVSLFLDRRSTHPSVKILMNVGKENSMLATGVVLECCEQWQPDNLKGPVVGHTMAKIYNMQLRGKLTAAQEALAMLMLGKSGDFTIKDLKDEILSRIDPEKYSEAKKEKGEEELRKNGVLSVYRRFLATKDGRTWNIYETTLRRIREYCEDMRGTKEAKYYEQISRGGIGSDAGEKYLQLLQFSDINLDWIDGFVRRMEKTMDAASRSIHLRNLRAVNNYAVKYEYTNSYVWKRYTIEKKSSTVIPISDREFADLFSFDLSERGDLGMYRDIALLGFYLIGINIVDMHALTNADYRNGYIYYTRSKTKRKYCIKVEPEAAELIEKYRNEDKSPGAKLLSWAARYKTHMSFNQHMNEEGLQRIGPTEREKIEGSYHGRNHTIYHAIVPGMTYYRLRHYWGFVAAKIRIPKEVAALCLGHGKKTVTDVYYTFQQEDIDNANRKVIDYVIKLIK